MCRQLACRQACLPRRPGARWPAGRGPAATGCRWGGATRRGSSGCPRELAPGRSLAERGLTAAAGHLWAAPCQARAALGRAPGRGRVRRRCVLPPRTGSPSGAGRSGWRSGQRAGHAAAPAPRGTGPESVTAGARPAPTGPVSRAAPADHAEPGRTGSPPGLPPEPPRAPRAEPPAGPAEPAPGARRDVRPPARPARGAPGRGCRSPARTPSRAVRAAVPPAASGPGCRPPGRRSASVRRAVPSPSRASRKYRARPAAGPRRPPGSARPGRPSR